MTDEHMEDSMPEMAIITGMSGAGRTEAMHVFEDLGYYCVDNMPAALIMDLVDIASKQAEDGQRRKLAIVCDARSGEHLGSLLDVMDELRGKGVDFKSVFLDADDDKLVARYKSSRRRHPLCSEGTTIAQGIQHERALMHDIREASDYVFNTSEMMPQGLRDRIRKTFAGGNQRKGLAVTVFSFGFKHGAPTDADLVIDVRFLPNPFYNPDLKPLTGLDAPVRDFVMLRDETIEFNRKWHELLDVVMPGYVAEGKQQLAIGVGCTGGQHRSVALAESTGDYLKSKGYRVSVAHRDLAKAIKKAQAASDNDEEAKA